VCAAGSDQLATESECEHLRELIFRAVLAAWEVVGADGQVVLSLAGGRKTMSADLQEAGNCFGATALVHVVGPEPMPAVLRGGAQSFLAPLSGLPDADNIIPANAVIPLIVGCATRSELIDLPLQGETVRSARFPIGDGLAGDTLISWPLPPEGASLVRELAQRQRASHRLLGNFLAQLAASEPHENWRSLYRLPAQGRFAPPFGWLSGFGRSAPRCIGYLGSGGAVRARCINAPSDRTAGRSIHLAVELAGAPQAAGRNRARPRLIGALAVRDARPAHPQPVHGHRAPARPQTQLSPRIRRL